MAKKSSGKQPQRVNHHGVMTWISISYMESNLVWYNSPLTIPFMIVHSWFFFFIMKFDECTRTSGVPETSASLCSS